MDFINPYQRCDACFMLPTRVMCIFLIVVQGAVIDYYLIHYNNNYWYAWIVGDIVLICIFIMAFFISYRHLLLVRKTSTEQTPVQVGSLPLAYVAWFVYSVLLAIRVAIIFKTFAFKLNESSFFGPNTLKVTVGLSAIIFLLLLLSHHDAAPKSIRQSHIDLLTSTVVFDILDSIDILDVLFERKNVDVLETLPGLTWAVVCIACINIVVPTLPLMTLSNIHFGYKILPETIETLHKISLLFLINTPLFTLRLVLWHRLDQDVSTFILKNFIVMCLVIHDFYNKGRFKRLHGDDVDAMDRVEMEEMIRDEDIVFNKSLRS